MHISKLGFPFACCVIEVWGFTSSQGKAVKNTLNTDLDSTRYTFGIAIVLAFTCTACSSSFQTATSAISGNSSVASQEAGNDSSVASQEPGNVGLTPGQPTVATNYSNGAALQSNTVGVSCQIDVPDCPKYPAQHGVFFDSYNGANLSQSACLQRASDYQGWCAANGGVSATFLQNGSVVASTIMPAQGFEIGGANYITTSAGAFLHSSIDPGDSNDPTSVATFKDVLFAYNQNPSLAENQLINMCGNGQRKIALMLSFEPAIWMSTYGGYYGEIADSTGGTVNAQIRSNISNVVSLISSITDSYGKPCFNELQFRFAPRGPASPLGWTSWSDTQYAENWQLLVSVRALVEEAAAPSLRRVYDLGAELAGIFNEPSDAGQNQRYLTTLWQQYLSTFGVSDTYGFSEAIAPGRTWKMLSVYDRIGIRPSQIALDVYDQAGFATALNELSSNGAGQIPLLIQETYYNDPPFSQSLYQAAQQNGFFIRTLMEWPLSPTDAVGFSTDYAPLYYPDLPKPQINATGFGCTDGHCLWVTGNYFSRMCQVQVYANDWTSLGTVPATCGNTEVDFRIPDAAYTNGNAGIRVVIVNEYGVWNDPVYIGI